MPQDGSGTITVSEMAVCLESLGQTATDEELKDVFDELDKDGSGTIDFMEFCQFMAGRMSDIDDPELLKEAFKIFDADGSGAVTKAELMDTMKDIMKNTGEALPEEDVDDIIREADKDGDGQIDCEEFMRVMQQF